jgi:hypothetical protein
LIPTRGDVISSLNNFPVQEPNTNRVEDPALIAFGNPDRYRNSPVITPEFPV